MTSAPGSTSAAENATSSETHKPRGSKVALAIAALGVVYGDIGTSPLYALRECFHGPHRIDVSEVNVFGVLSLVFWVLIVIISFKYMLFVLRADNRGEGGILALTALAVPKRKPGRATFLFGLGIFGAALLYGDGILTPAVTVLSAIEGLKIATPVFENLVVPLTCIILFGLFWFQKHGTARIGAVFGPIMIVWFTVLAVLGINKIVEYPAILAAISPTYAVDFLFHHAGEAFLIMGSLFLVVTGGEALYADMGHFGRGPIRRAWFVAVLPGLVLNYFGQGALLLQNPAASENPFYLMAPEWALYPLVILATCASVIASQALISGVFSLTRQAIQLGISPRMQIVHTSSQEIGQIYLPQVNWALLIGCLWLVIEFRSSSNLAAAYGISVSATMVITTLLLAVVQRRLWKWSLPVVVFAAIGFLAVDMIFLSANLLKVADGGYVPLIIGGALYTLMATWLQGRQILRLRLRNAIIPWDNFRRRLNEMKLSRVSGTAVFMVGDPTTTPPALVHNVKHNKVLHEKIIILSVITKEIPYVPSSERVAIEVIDENFTRVIARYGFSDSPDVNDIFAGLNEKGLAIDIATTTFFLGRETIIASETPGMAIWREHLFSFMSRNAQRATAFFNIPAAQVVEVGLQIEM